MRRRLRFGAAMVAALALLGAGEASAATRAVDDDGKATPSNCNANTPASPTIQGAINASGPGDSIAVCPGTYTETPRIPATKDGLTLYSTQPLQAVIKAPPVGPLPDKGDIVHVQGAHNVKILAFTITGPLPDTEFCQPFAKAGVRVGNDGSATIAGNHITEIRSTSPALRGCQNGIGVQVGRASEGNDTGHATVALNLIDKYQKNGMTIDGAGSSGDVLYNRVQGDGEQPLSSINVAAQNGIQFGRGATGEIRSNSVFDNTYNNPLLATSTGYLVFNLPGNVRVGDNLGERNDDNFVFENVQNLTVDENTANDATEDDGIYVDSDSTDNKFLRNSASGNQNLDCEDDSHGPGTAGTANLWSGNRGETADPPEICRAHGRGDGHGHGHHGHHDHE
jgi:hypothetical protein